MSSTADSESTSAPNWKEHLLIVHDASQCKEEHDPPENAIIVFISPVEVEIRTQVYLCGGITAMCAFGQSVTGHTPRVFFLGKEKIASKVVGKYSLFLSGHGSESDDLIAAQLDELYRAFCFYHGSIDRVKAGCEASPKRFSSTMTRIWASLVSSLRPPRDTLHSAFRPVPSLGLPHNENRHYAMAAALLERVQRRPGILGGCVLHRQRAIYTQLPPELTTFVLALLQPTQSTSYTEEDNKRIQRRGLKIREMMLRGKNRLIRSREYKLNIYPNTFNGHEMVDLLIEKGEARTRDAAKQLGRRLMQAGVIRQVQNEQDFRDEQKLYRFRVDEDGQRPDFAATTAASSGRGVILSHSSTGSESGSDITSPSEPGTAYRDLPSRHRPARVDMRPLVLVGHGRDARTTAALHGLTLPVGVHLLPVFLCLDQLVAVCDMAQALRGDRDPDVVELGELRTTLARSCTDASSDGITNTCTSDLSQNGEAVDTSFKDDMSDVENFDAIMTRLKLSEFQMWLIEAGWNTVPIVRERLLSLPPQALVRFAADYPGDSTMLNDALVSAHLTLTASSRDERSGVSDSHTTDVSMNEGSQIQLYLQGLGNTVLVTLIAPSHSRDQGLFTDLASDANLELTVLEESLAAQADIIGGTDSPKAVDEYNFVTFDSETHGIAGWCNTDRSDREQKLLPDTDDDRAFVKAVAELHATFQAPSTEEVMEIQLRKNYHTSVYGCTAFGVESYLQFRHRGPSEPRDAASRPWDDDFALLPEQAKDRFRHHGINFI